MLWRDYWQQIWVVKTDDILTDLKTAQQKVSNYQIPKAVIEATTGIIVIDEAIKTLYKSGYMHNHMRMYIASICCNIACCHWLEPSRWLYAHLLDGDLASNMLSWQWVSGTNSKKKYYANQGNINKYFYSNQKNSFLDIDYNEFEALQIPKELTHLSNFTLKTELPYHHQFLDLVNKETLIYNYYNLDPNWRKEENLQRILLLEPSIFEKFPVSRKCIDFTISLSENIKDIILYVGEFDELLKHIQIANIHYKEHPLNKHYKGKEEPREWMSDVAGYYPSFYAFWKKCKKQLQW